MLRITTVLACRMLMETYYCASLLGGGATSSSQSIVFDIRHNPYRIRSANIAFHTSLCSARVLCIRIRFRLRCLRLELHLTHAQQCLAELFDDVNWRTTWCCDQDLSSIVSSFSYHFRRDQSKHVKARHSCRLLSSQMSFSRAA